MSIWLLCLTTNLFESRRWAPLRLKERPEDDSINAISCIQTEWAWDGESLIASSIDMVNVELATAPELRRQQLKSWADKVDRRSPMIIASLGGRHFVPALRRAYLADDLAYPAVFGLADVPGPFRDELFAKRTHLDLARFLDCETGRDLCRFLEACGVTPILARASTRLTEEATLLRSVITFHLMLRILVSAGRLLPADRRRAEDHVTDLISTSSDAVKDMCIALASRSDPAELVRT